MAHSGHSTPSGTTSSADASTDGSMSMSSMAMTFYTARDTPLFSQAWKPSSTGTYAGTCIFLILLAAGFRLLLAVKAWKEQKWLDQEFDRRYVAVQGRGTMAERIRSDGDSERASGEDKNAWMLSENGVEEEVVVVRRRGADVRAWRLSVDPVRATMDVILAGVGYLLMLAVMTMNVGYFLSVLAGVFVGSLAIGRYTINYEGH